MKWRGLLVSVRDAAEATAALEGGADIIDVKEPRHGSLGPAAPEAIAAIARIVGERRPWTMACGELGDQVGHEPVGNEPGSIATTSSMAIRERVDRVLELLEHPATPPAAVKIGLAHSAGTDWRGRLRSVYESLAWSGDRVAVAYADWRRAGAPPPPEVIAAAAGLGCSVFLLDTFDKSAGGLLSCCPAGMPAGWVTAARAAGLRVAVAGRLSTAELPVAWALGPDVVAVRSAVCVSGRDGIVDAELVRSAVDAGRGYHEGASRPSVPCRELVRDPRHAPSGVTS